MGNSVSTLSLPSRKLSNQSLSPPSATTDRKKFSFFNRSRSSLHFRKRSKSSLSELSDNSGSNSYNFNSNNNNNNRNYSISSDDHSDFSNSSDPQSPGYKNISKPRDSTTTANSFTSSVPNGVLPDWACHTRVCDDGRTRHTVENAPYMLPNDLTESDRLDAQHYLVRFIFKGNYNVKLDRDAKLKILDVATGTGVWALEMAHEFPNAEIHGVDISPIFPTEIKPSNCHFQLCNILEGLPFPDNHFDFVYQRLLVYALSPAQRKQVYNELQRVLKPEGYLQLVESDGIVYNPGPQTERINNLSLETSLSHGVDPREVQNMKSGLKHTGYTGVNSFHIALPVGDWGGRAGTLSKQNFHGLATIWLKGEFGKMTQEQCDAAIAIADEESEKNNSYYKVWLVIGQKPSVAATQLKEARKAAVALINSATQAQSNPPDAEAQTRRSQAAA